MENPIFLYLSLISKTSSGVQNASGNVMELDGTMSPGFMNCESYIREEERSGCRENGEKLISHGERILRS